MTMDKSKQAVTTKFILAVDKGDKTVNSVSVVGPFTRWIAIPLYFENGFWEARLGVNPGTHQYKFVVDGVWIHDDGKPSVANDQGTRNNTLVIFPGANVVEVPSSCLKHVKSGKVFRDSQRREILKPVMDVDGTSRQSAKFEKYENKSEVMEYKAAADSTLPSKKRKSEDLEEEVTVSPMKRIKVEEVEEAVSEKKKKKKKDHDQVLVKYLDRGDEDYANLNELKPTGFYLTPLDHKKTKLAKKFSDNLREKGRKFELEFGFTSTDQGTIREGDDFQASIPDLLEEREENFKRRELQMWDPAALDTSEEELAEYIETAKTHHQMSQEQALSILAWKRYKLEDAKRVMETLAPIRYESTIHESPSKNTVLQIYPIQQRRDK